MFDFPNCKPIISYL